MRDRGPVVRGVVPGPQDRTSPSAGPAAGETAGLEVASVYRERSVGDNFTALEDYWAGFVSARVLDYLSGLEANGLSRHRSRLVRVDPEPSDALGYLEDCSQEQCRGGSSA